MKALHSIYQPATTGWHNELLDVSEGFGVVKKKGKDYSDMKEKLIQHGEGQGCDFSFREGLTRKKQVEIIRRKKNCLL